MENAYGLIVGIANYQQVGTLPRSVLADAQAIHRVLTDPSRCAYLRMNVDALLDGKASGDGLRKALATLAQRCNEESTAFFYISCHGHWIKSGPLAGVYILPVDTVDTTNETLARTAISGVEFTEMLRSIPARKVVAVFDTCYSGGVGEPKCGLQRFTHIPESFYEALASGRGRVIMASSRSSEASYVLPGDRNSLFTQHMLTGLRGGVSGPGGVIRIFDLFHYLQPRVIKDCPNQHPIFKAVVEENFPVALCCGGKTVDAATYRAMICPTDVSAGKARRIMDRLDLLLGTEEKLAEHDRDVLFAALSFATEKRRPYEECETTVANASSDHRRSEGDSGENSMHIGIHDSTRQILKN